MVINKTCRMIVEVNAKQTEEEEKYRFSEITYVRTTRASPRHLKFFQV